MNKGYIKHIAETIESWGDILAEEVYEVIENHPNELKGEDFDEDLEQVCDWLGY